MNLQSSNLAERRASADIRADIGRVNKAALITEVAEIEQRRQWLLLHGTDDQLHENKAALDAARLVVERAEALVGELTRQAAEAEAHERTKELEAAHANAVNAKSELDRATDEAESASMHLRGSLDEMKAASAIIAEWNRRHPDRHIEHPAFESARLAIWAKLR
jgi:response regulator RpfG family c-di-GMP phosphodiesterase